MRSELEASFVLGLAPSLEVEQHCLNMFAGAQAVDAEIDAVAGALTSGARRGSRLSTSEPLPDLTRKFEKIGCSGHGLVIVKFSSSARCRRNVATALYARWTAAGYSARVCIDRGSASQENDVNPAKVAPKRV